MSVQFLNQKEMILESANGFFNTMLSLSVEPWSGPPPAIQDSDRLMGGVSFTGEKVRGHFWITLSDSMGRMVSSALLGMTPEEITDPAQVDDVVGEMCNIMGGIFKGLLCDAGLNCVLSVPIRKRGADAVLIENTKVLRENAIYKIKEHVISVTTEIEQFNP